VPGEGAYARAVRCMPVMVICILTAVLMTAGALLPPKALSQVTLAVPLTSVSVPLYPGSVPTHSRYAPLLPCYTTPRPPLCGLVTQTVRVPAAPATVLSWYRSHMERLGYSSQSEGYGPYDQSLGFQRATVGGISTISVQIAVWAERGNHSVVEIAATSFPPAALTPPTSPLPDTMVVKQLNPLSAPVSAVKDVTVDNGAIVKQLYNSLAGLPRLGLTLCPAGNGVRYLLVFLRGENPVLTATIGTSGCFAVWIAGSHTLRAAYPNNAAGQEVWMLLSESVPGLVPPA